MGMEVTPPPFVKIKKPTFKERVLVFIVASFIFIAILVGAFCLAQFLTEGIQNGTF